MSATRTPPPPRGRARARILERAIEHVAEHGIGDLTLRGLAEALGTSHRVLIHHFGSRQGLLVAIVQAVEQRERAAMQETLGAARPGRKVPPQEAAWAWWEHISARSLWPNERLFFELYVQAIQGREYAAPVLEGVVDDWVEAAAQRLVDAGMSPSSARAQARLGLAVTRGLLLDLLATGDRTGVDDAMRAFIEMQLAALHRHASKQQTP